MEADGLMRYVPLYRLGADPDAAENDRHDCKALMVAVG
jgi:hypothetical protein